MKMSSVKDCGQGSLALTWIEIHFLNVAVDTGCYFQYHPIVLDGIGWDWRTSDVIGVLLQCIGWYL